VDTFGLYDLESYKKQKGYFGGICNFLKSNVRMSGGVGLAMDMGPSQIEMLYNGWHLLKKDDKPNPFQIRFSLDD